MRSTHRRAWAVAFAVLGIFLAGVLTPAAGHAVLLASSPVDGSTVDTSPSQLSLRFDEDVSVGSTAFHLFDGTGRPVAVPAAQALQDPGAADATVVGADLPPLPRGRYLVRWQSITSDDFHAVSGSFTFGVGVRAGSVTDGGAAARPLGAPTETVMRTLVVCGYAVVVGSLVLLVLVHGMLSSRPRSRRTIARCSTAGLTISAGGLVGLAVQLSVGSGTAPPSSFLTYWGVTLAGLLVASACGHGLARRADGATSLVLPTLAGSVAAVAAAYGLGHLGHGPASSGTVLSTLHVAATAVWTGGVAVLAVVVLAARRSPDPVPSREAMRRFGVVAIPAVLLSTFTGFLLARPLVPGLSGLTDTGYGRGLLLKLALVGIAVGLGGLAFWQARRGAGRQVGARLVAEVTVMVAVLALAASMSGGQPPDDLRWRPSPSQPATVGLLAADVDDLVITLTLGPGVPGSNFATVDVLETRRPTPATVSTVLVAFGQAVEVPAVLQRDGGTTLAFPGADPNTTWLASSVLTTSGAHDIRVTVRRDGLPDSVVTFPWQLAPQPGTELGGTELSGAWTVLAAGVVVVAGLVVCLALWRRRLRPGDPPEQEALRESIADASLV